MGAGLISTEISVTGALSLGSIARRASCAWYGIQGSKQGSIRVR